MAGLQDFVEFVEDFLGPQTVIGSPVGSDMWDLVVTGTTPTAAVGGVNGELTVAHSSATEVQNACVYQSDVLNYDIDNLIRVEMRVKMGQAAVDSATMLAFGLASARNDAIDSIAAAAIFRVVGAVSTTAVVVETDDSVHDNNNIATGATLINAYKRFVIDFSGGKSDVKFYIDGVRVAASTTFDMSSYASGLQPYIQIQKTSDNNTDSVVVDYIKIVSKR